MLRLPDLPPCRDLPASAGDAPAPLICDCGARRLWEVFPHRGSAFVGRVEPFWCRPRINPCVDCEAEHAARDAAAAFGRRQRHAGVSMPYRDFTWNRTRVQVLPPERLSKAGAVEADRGFVRAVKASPGTLGVLARNISAARHIASWTPTCGHSLYIHGGQGCGKTLYASALVSRLLQRADARAELMPAEMFEAWLGPESRAGAREIGRHIVYRQRPAWSCLLVTHDELYERVKLTWERDRQPLAQVDDADVLILDDLGSVGGAVASDGGRARKQPPGAAEGEQRLIRERYRAGRHLIITSNIPFYDVTANGRVIIPGVEKWYGKRVASRLEEMVGEHVLSLGALDWRGVR